MVATRALNAVLRIWVGSFFKAHLDGLIVDEFHSVLLATFSEPQRFSNFSA